MSNQKSQFNNQEESSEESQRVQHIFLRILPFWPFIILALLFAMVAAFIYLRYQPNLYVVKTKFIVNDESQQKNANLQEIFTLDTRNLSVETEREIEILGSRDLLGKLVSSLQLNVQYSKKGYIKSGQYFKNIPIVLELEKPDSIKYITTGEVELINNKIRFNNVVYPLDTFVTSKYGFIRWKLNRQFLNSEKNEKWFITILPISNTINIIQKALTIKPISKQSSILELSYTETLPERAIIILNSLIKLYGTTTLDYKSRISANTLRFLDERLRLVNEELSGVEKNLQNFKSSQGIMDFGAQGALYLDQVKDADLKIAELDVKVDVLNKTEQYVNKRNNTVSPVPASLGISDLVLTGLLNQLYQTEFELEKTKQVSGIKNPQVAVLENAIFKLKPSINESINNLKLSMLASRQRLQSDNKRLMTILNKIPQNERLLVDISRQQSIKNAIYTFLLQKREESAIAAEAILPNYRVIEKPESSGLVSPVPDKIYGNAILIALMIVALIIYLREFVNNRILFKAQIENGLPQIPIIGELIFQPSDNNSPVVVEEGKRTILAEQFRDLRTNLQYVTAGNKEKCKFILVTSSISGEGKSFVTINTAISLTLTGAKVVILEFDLRMPKISNSMGISRDPGLSNYLINRAVETEIIKVHPSIPNLSIIPSGPIPPNPAELIAGERLLELAEYLKLHFDYVFIDSPPLLAVTDAKILANISQNTIFVIRHNYTNASFLKLIRDTNHKKILPKISLVFNGIITKKILGYGYAKGYGYGYGYGYGNDAGYTEKVEKKSMWKNIFKRRK